MKHQITPPVVVVFGPAKAHCRLVMVEQAQTAFHALVQPFAALSDAVELNLKVAQIGWIQGTVFFNRPLCHGVTVN